MTDDEQKAWFADLLESEGSDCNQAEYIYFTLNSFNLPDASIPDEAERDLVQYLNEEVLDEPLDEGGIRAVKALVDRLGISVTIKGDSSVIDDEDDPDDEFDMGLMPSASGAASLSGDEDGDDDDDEEEETPPPVATPRTMEPTYHYSSEQREALLTRMQAYFGKKPESEEVTFTAPPPLYPRDLRRWIRVRNGLLPILEEAKEPGVRGEKARADLDRRKRTVFEPLRHKSRPHNLAAKLIDDYLNGAGERDLVAYIATYYPEL